MRIFYASDKTPNPQFQSNLWRDNLYGSLVDLGHEVIEFDYDLRETFSNLDPADPQQKAFIDENRPKLSAALLAQVQAAHAAQPLDLFFSYFYDACVLPETLDTLKTMGIPTVNWYCNGSYQLHLVSEIAPHYTWCLVPEEFRIADYHALGAHPLYCQEAANPKIYKPYPEPLLYDVTFVGQAYGDRPMYIDYLRKNGIDVRIWGSHWSRYSDQRSLTEAIGFPFRRKPLKYIVRLLRHLLRIQNGITFPAAMLGAPLSDIDMIRLYSQSKINLGFSTCGNTHETGKKILQVRLRDFEVPMSGGFYMVEYMEELEAFYEIDREIVCYRNLEDLRDKIRFYLSHDTEREQIRQAGYQRCLRDHTWKKRFQEAFSMMGFTSCAV